MVHVESLAIDEIGYDADRSTLFVRFAHGGWYSYFAVPKSLYEAFVAAQSHGAFFQGQIREHYPYRRGR